MWFLGMQSIRLPHGSDKSRFPLYILGLWEELAVLGAAQHSWKQVLEWIDSHTESCALEAQVTLESARCLVQRLAWNSPIGQDPGFTTQELSWLIGAGRDKAHLGWLSDSILSLLIDSMNHRIDGDIEYQKVFAAPLVVALELARGARNSEYSRTHLLNRYEAEVKGKKCHDIFFPFFDRSCHWIAIHVSFQKQTIEYGKIQCLY